MMNYRCQRASFELAVMQEKYRGEASCPGGGGRGIGWGIYRTADTRRDAVMVAQYIVFNMLPCLLSLFLLSSTSLFDSCNRMKSAHSHLCCVPIWAAWKVR